MAAVDSCQTSVMVDYGGFPARPSHWLEVLFIHVTITIPVGLSEQLLISCLYTWKVYS